MLNLATPFVRYDTGDQLHWKSFEPSASGIAWPRIGPVEGRTGDVIHLPSGRSIPMPGLTLVMRWLEGLRQYQFIQTGPASVTVRLDRGPRLCAERSGDRRLPEPADRPDVNWTIVWDA